MHTLRLIAWSGKSVWQWPRVTIAACEVTTLWWHKNYNYHLSHSYSMRQIIKSVCICQCICPSESTLMVAFLDNFTKTGTDLSTLKKKNEFVRGQYHTTLQYICLVMARYIVSYIAIWRLYRGVSLSRYLPLRRNRYSAQLSSRMFRQHIALSAVGDVDKGSLAERGE